MSGCTKSHLSQKKQKSDLSVQFAMYLHKHRQPAEQQRDPGWPPNTTALVRTFLPTLAHQNIWGSHWVVSQASTPYSKTSLPAVTSGVDNLTSHRGPNPRLACASGDKRFSMLSRAFLAAGFVQFCQKQSSLNLRATYFGSNACWLKNRFILLMCAAFNQLQKPRCEHMKTLEQIVSRSIYTEEKK